MTVTTERGVFEAVGKTPEGATYTVRVPVKAPRRGEVLHQSRGEAESTLAKIVCRP